jgi:hypothetical protein
MFAHLLWSKISLYFSVFPGQSFGFKMQVFPFMTSMKVDSLERFILKPMYFLSFTVDDKTNSYDQLFIPENHAFILIDKSNY